MNVLVIGTGGREHAMVRALKKSSKTSQVYVYPGSDGIFQEAQPFSADKNLSHSEISKLCKEKEIALIAVGPEAPLVEGLSDYLRSQDFKVFGPDQTGALLEGDKLFAKEFMNEFSVPTADYIEVTDTASLEKALDQFEKEGALPFVFKYRYLAGGKGVLVSKSRQEVLDFAKKFKVHAEQKDVVAYLEKPLSGYELSCICLVNESSYVLCPYLQDHKRLKEKDEGPNTGGMGVAGPMKVEEPLAKEIEEKIIAPTLKGFKARNMNYRGVIYIGLMVSEQGASVLEYNVRFGDPEAQLIFPLAEDDWLEAFDKIASGQEFEFKFSTRKACTVVLAAPGYPENPQKGGEIKGLSNLAPESFYHAGTQSEGETWKVNGGRVLNVLGFADSLTGALEQAYKNVDRLSFEGMQFRKDIGQKLLS